MATAFTVPILCVLIALASAGLSPHFEKWLKGHPEYSKYDFMRSDLGGLSFGGKVDPNDKVENQPVIFFHGVTGNCSGYVPIRDYFLTRGYKNSELYATTWGTPNISMLPYFPHKQEFVMVARKFMEAVLNYTEAPKIDIISHSMGVTLCRKAIKGGQAWNEDLRRLYTVGKPLTKYIDTFVGLGGANLGTNNCANPTKQKLPICNQLNGFYPGVMVGTRVVNRSAYLDDLLRDGGYEGDYRFSVYSTYDEAFGNEGKVYCQQTAIFPNTTNDIEFNTPKYDHMAIRDLTAEMQHDLVRYHSQSAATHTVRSPNLFVALLGFLLLRFKIAL